MDFKSGEWVEAEVIPDRPAFHESAQKISIVLPFIDKEKQSAIELLNISRNIAGRISRTIFLVPFKGIDFGDVRTAAEGAFATVATIQDCEGVLSDWNDRQQMRSASGPNSSFRQVAWFFYLNRKFGSWLWLEPDCWPVTSSWLYDLEREYFDSGKPFMGVRMTFPSSEKQYMNGVGIYPWNAIQYAPLLVQSAMWTQHPEYEVGFDVAGGNDVLNNAHMSRRIQLTGHLSKRQDPVRPETSLCHGRPNLSGGLNGGKEVADVIQSLPPIQKMKGGDATCSASTAGLSGNTAKSRQPAASNAVPTVQPVGAAGSLSSKNGSDYGAVSKQIRNHVEGLVQLWGDSPSRKVLIVKELRKAKLVPKHFR